MKLHDGQTYDQVLAILGKPDGLAMPSSDKLAVYARWGGPLDPNISSPSIGVTFEDGLVTHVSINGIAVPQTDRPANGMAN